MLLSVPLVALLTASQHGAPCPVEEVAGASAVPANAFGHAVALSGDTLVVADPRDDDAGTDSGALFVFERSGAAWAEVAKLTVPGVTWLGADVAIDGDVIVAGATDGTLPGAADRVVFFERVGGTWTAVADFGPANPAAQDAFGWSVSVAGAVAVVGRPFAGAFPGPGSAHVFVRSGGQWSEAQALNGGFLFGAAVSTDGLRLLVAAASPTVYELVAGTWTAVATLVTTEPYLGSFFNKDLAIAGDLAFAAGEKLDTHGTLHVFERGAGAWSEVAWFEEPLSLDGTYYGSTVSYSDGVALVGAPLYGRRAYGYRETAGTWAKAFELDAPEDVADFAVATAIDGSTLAVSRIGSASLGSTSAVELFELLHGSLTGCPPSLSLAAGGKQLLALDAGAAHAGAIHLVLGSASGTAPGIPLGALHLPLQLDAYLLWTLEHPTGPPLTGALGVLDGAGRGAARFSLPAATDPALAGLVLHHAFVALDATSGALVFASDSAPLALVP